MQAQQERTQFATGVPRRIVHGNFFVNNHEKSMDFYNNVAGVEETFSLPWGAGFISNGNTHHDMALVQVSEERTGSRGAAARALGVTQLTDDFGRYPGLNHFAYEMKHEADLVAAYERAKQAGVKMTLVEDRVVTRSIYFFDPEGNGVELTVDMLANWREHRYKGAKIEHADYIPGKNPPSTQNFCNYNPEIRRIERAAIHPRRFSHATLIASDFEAMVNFYTDVVGLNEAWTAPDRSYSLLRGHGDHPGYSLAIFPATTNRPPGVHHIGFELVDNNEFDDIEGNLKRMNVGLELRVDHATKKAIFVKDPDGLLVQFYVEEPTFLDSISDLDSETRLNLS
jgi:catechol 2,3-dioxygenase